MKNSYLSESQFVHNISDFSIFSKHIEPFFTT